MIQGQCFTLSYTLTVDVDWFRLAIAITWSDEIILVYIDASSAFQTNIISDQNIRVCITLPIIYREWFRARLPNIHCQTVNSKELVMKPIWNIQGTKDTGFEWYQLLAKIVTNLGWKLNIVCKGVWFYLIKNNQTLYLILAMENLLYMSNMKYHWKNYWICSENYFYLNPIEE